MKQITVKVLRSEDETLLLKVLEAFQASGIISFETSHPETDDQDSMDSTDEELLDLLNQADREKGETLL